MVRTRNCFVLTPGVTEKFVIEKLRGFSGTELDLLYIRGLGSAPFLNYGTDKRVEFSISNTDDGWVLEIKLVDSVVGVVQETA